VKGLTVLLAFSLLSPAALPAQADSLKLPAANRIARDREMALARSAGPATVADSADIWVLGDRGYEKVVAGSNGYGCIVQRGLAGQHLIPRCDDASGAAAFYPVYQMIEEFRRAGRTFGDARRAIVDGFKSGRFKEPRFGGLSYMYSVDAVFTSASGQRVEFTPHVMIYWPGCNVKQLGMSESSGMRGTGLGFVDYGTPECTLIINTPPGTARRVEDVNR
jgi:hypothetical protein